MKRIIWFLVFLLAAASPLSAADPYLHKRQAMVKRDMEGRGITDKRVLAVMGTVPRHLFVDAWQRGEAYADHPLPIGEGQTISQPYVVALMTEALHVNPSDRVLEIGTGSGYQAAVLAGLAKEVYSIEIRKSLADAAAGRLREMGYRNVWVKYADGYFGWEEHAPFDAIIITAAVNHIPPSLIKQLKEGGAADPSPGEHGLLSDAHPGDQEEGGGAYRGADGAGGLRADDRGGAEKKVRSGGFLRESRNLTLPFVLF